MSEQFPALLILAPLLSALLISGLNWIDRRLCFPVGLVGLALSIAAGIGLLGRVLEQGVVFYRLGGWAPPWGISYVVDHLNGLVAPVIPLVAFINLIATYRSAREQFAEKIGLFYTLYMLFTVGLIGIVVTGDAFNLYVLLEVASLAGYGLVSLGDDRAPLAALNYVYMGTIGASFYLLGVGYLYIVTGSLNMQDIAGLLPDLYTSRAVFVAFIFCLVGVWIKMAFFPLHGWLPNAYTHAPGPAASLVAPLMTKVMVYVMIRVIFSVFTPRFAFFFPQFGRTLLSLDEAVVWFASIAIVAGSVLALAEKDLKRMLAFIIVSEVGYMVGGIWLANRDGVTGAVLHIINDAVMTLCLFLAAGAIAYKCKTTRIDELGGLFRRMPFTMAGLAVGGLAVIGVPPTCGFFSKWYLILGAVYGGRYHFMIALIISSLAGVALFFRIFEKAYYGPVAHGHDPVAGQEHATATTMDEAPMSMVVPLLATALLIILMGLFTGDIVGRIIRFTIPPIIG